MGYDAEFAPAADKELDRLLPLLASAILDGIETLAADPVRLGRRSHFPYLPGRMMYQFWTEVEGVWRWVTDFYRFSQDEARIVILDIAVQEVP